MIFPEQLRWNMIFLVLPGKMIFLFPENIILFFRRKMKDDLSQRITCKYDVFFKCSVKMVFPRKLHWNMIFLVAWSEKMVFLFPANIILFFRRKMKDGLPQKNTWKYDILFKYPEIIVFPKKYSAGIWSFLYYLKRWYFFLWKIWYFFFGWKMKDGLSQEIHGIMIFSVYVYKWYKYNITPLQKKLKMIFSRENTPKVDWHSRLHSRKGSSNSLYFYGDLHRRFHILLSSKKTKNK